MKARVEGSYDVQGVPCGKVYKWVPAHALIECGCGHVMDADASHAVRPACGADHTGVVREVPARHLPDEVLRRWHAGYEAWIRCRENHTEYQEWSEIRFPKQGRRPAAGDSGPVGQP